MPAGRPKKQFKKDVFERLCAMFCTEEEICRFFETTDKTLSKWCEETYGANFSETYKRFSADGKISLRRMQIKLAERSPAVAIWLGKQYLGQRDNVIIENQRQASAIEQIAKALIDNGTNIG